MSKPEREWGDTPIAVSRTIAGRVGSGKKGLVEEEPLNIDDVPLRERARDHILEAILRGHLDPDERLVVTDLAAWLDMSRTPVRDALKRLAVTRVVEPNGTSGYRVVKPSPRDLRDLVELLRLLEPRAAADGAAKDATARSALAARLEAIGNDDGGHRFHVTLGAAAANRYVSQAVEILNERLATARRDIGRPCVDGSDHAQIVRAIREGAAERARTATSSHLMALRHAIYGTNS